MAEALLFKRGCDLATEPRIDDEETVTCVGCEAMETDGAALENGWQLAPPVCPDCLHWQAVEVPDA